MGSDQKNNAKKGNYSNNNREQGPRKYFNNNNNNNNGKKNADGVPILTYGANSNYLEWKEKITEICLVKFGFLGRCIKNGAYWLPPVVPNNYNPATDPHGLALDALKQAMKHRQNQVNEMLEKRPAMYGYILTTLSSESKDKIKTDPTYVAYNANEDPLNLFLSIKKYHGSGAGHISVETGMGESRAEYAQIKQLGHESLVAFKTRFDQKLENYTAYGNPVMPPASIAYDFFRALDEARYGEFKCNIINNFKNNMPATLMDMYEHASTFVVAPPAHTVAKGGVAYTTIGDRSSGGRYGVSNGGRGRGRGRGRWKVNENSSSSSSRNDKVAEVKDDSKPNDIDSVVCFGCGQKGHYKSKCPNKKSHYIDHDDVTDAEIFHCDHVFATGGNIWSQNDVLLDNQSNVSIIHRDMCSNVRYVDRPICVGGAGGKQLELNMIGELDGFGTVYVPDIWKVNILCFAEVSDMYRISYSNESDFVVHMPGNDVTFARKGSFYIGNINDWHNACYVTSNFAPDTTEADRIGKFSKKQLELASEARTLIANAGYPSASECIKMVNSGNLLNCDITAADIERAIYIWGLSPEFVRGKLTKSKVNRMDVDLTIQHRIKRQSLLLDIMHINGQHFAIGLVVPLQLLVCINIKKETTSDLKICIESLIMPLYNNGYTVDTIYVEPQSAMLALKATPLGIRIESCAAGDHLDALDIRIRRVKETFRCCVAGLEFKLPESKIPDLVSYCVKRANARSTSSKLNDVAPIVEFTGRKILYNKDMCMRFGTYCEILNTNHRVKGHGEIKGSQSSPNNAFNSKSHPAIALYPCSNGYGSWVFWDLSTNANVTRSHWKIMVMSDLIRQRIAQISDNKTAMSNIQQEIIPPTTMNDSEVSPDIEIQVGDNPSSDINVEEVLQEEYEETYEGIIHFTVHQGMKERPDDTILAVKNEFKQVITDKQALEPIRYNDMSQIQKSEIIDSSMKLKDKFDAQGIYEKLKARLVADGSQQDRSLYPNNSSPTVQTQSLMVCLAIAAKENRKAGVMDIGNAYLNANMEGHPVYMRLNPVLTDIVVEMYPNFKDYVHNKKLIVKLNKAVNGCLHSGKLWYNEITAYLISLGYKVNDIDKCVLSTDCNGKQSTIIVYVDDILILCEHESEIRRVMDACKDKYIEIKSKISNDFNYLGMHIVMKDGRAHISMEGYIEELLNFYNVKGSKTTPGTNQLFSEGTGETVSEKEREAFHSCVAKILYLGTHMRYEILNSVSFLCTRVSNPTTADQGKLYRLLQYINGSKDHQLILDASDMKVRQWIDAAFGIHIDGRSHSASCLALGNAFVSCKSSKQKLTSANSTEAEIAATSDKHELCIVLVEFLMDMGYDVGKPTIFQDNTATISMITSGGGKSRTKHYNVRKNILHEKYRSGSFDVVYVSTKDMIADVLTKPLQGELFKKFADRLLGRS